MEGGRLGSVRPKNSGLTRVESRSAHYQCDSEFEHLLGESSSVASSEARPNLDEQLRHRLRGGGVHLDNVRYSVGTNEERADCDSPLLIPEPSFMDGITTSRPGDEAHTGYAGVARIIAPAASYHCHVKDTTSDRRSIIQLIVVSCLCFIFMIAEIAGQCVIWYCLQNINSRFKSNKHYGTLKHCIILLIQYLLCSLCII